MPNLRVPAPIPALDEASSKGSFYNENIKGDHSYWINDYDGSNGDKIVIEYVD